jgi:hypothetical protein
VFDGWFSYGGTEIINKTRVLEYIRNMLPNLDVKDPCGDGCSCDHLPDLLNEKPYATPLFDDAPWLDPDATESFDLLGVLPLNVSGIVDDTVTAETVESMGDGGWVVNRRRALKEMRFSVVMAAMNDSGAEYGVNWLKSVLDGSCASQDEEPRDQLCFLSECVDPADFTGRVEQNVHTLSEWTLFKSGWEGANTLRLNEPDSWAEVSVPGSCGDVEWTLQLQGQEGNLVAIVQDGESQLYRLDGTVQTFGATTGGATIRLAVPPIDGLASWAEPVAGDVGADELDLEYHVDSPQTAPGGESHTWDQVTTIPLRLSLIKVTSNARFETNDDACADEFYRFIRRVAHTEGPRVRRTEYMSGGGVMTYVDFLLTAEKPYIYGMTVNAVKGTSAILSPTTLPYRVVRLTSNIGQCPVTVTSTILDPLGPVTPPPPTVSTDEELTLRDQILGAPNTRPYALIIPEETIPAWLSVVPVIRITAGATDLRFVEVRFFPIPIDDTIAASDIDPCSACGSFEISYVPAGTTFTIDGTEERATISQGDVRNEAQHLITAAGGKGAMTWPVLSCGVGYMALVDSRGQTIDGIEIDLAVRM